MIKNAAIKVAKDIRPFSWSNIGRIAAVSAIGISTAVIIEKLIDELQELRIKAKSPKYYAKMMEAHPSLKKEDPKLVAKYWASLYHFAPSMAQEPIAAGAFIRQSIRKGLHEEFGGPPPDTYKTLAEVEQKAQKSSPTDKGFLRSMIGGVGSAFTGEMTGA